MGCGTFLQRGAEKDPASLRSWKTWDFQRHPRSSLVSNLTQISHRLFFALPYFPTSLR